jgi:uncharacterized membrane protein YoaK (UPF0700 family)
MWQKTPQIYRYMFGGFVLTVNGGFVNVVAMLSSLQQPVSHLTGIASNLAIALVDRRERLLPLILTIVFFVLGSAISGLIIDSTQLRFGRRYGFILMVESLVLATAVPLLHRASWSGIYAMTLACGLQNGMVTTYSGAVVRTSHITGLMTDLGIYMGKWLWRRERESWRAQMYLTLFCGFVLGGVFGTWSFGKWGVDALYLATILTGCIGLGYWVWRQMLAYRS